MSKVHGYRVHATSRHGIECFDVIEWVCGVPVTREATYLSEHAAWQWIARKCRRDGGAA